MDGLVFVLFFSPVLISICFILSMISFCIAFWAGFGLEVREAIIGAGDDSLAGYLNQIGVLSFLADPPFRTTILYPLVLNFIAVGTVLTTYTLGRILHGKRGWRFFQFQNGGIRFTLLQCGTWVSLSWALVLPWMAVDHWGVLNRLGWVRSPTTVPDEHGSLLLAGAAVGMMSELFAFLSLMVFDPNPTESLSRKPCEHVVKGSRDYKRRSTTPHTLPKCGPKQYSSILLERNQGKMYEGKPRTMSKELASLQEKNENIHHPLSRKAIAKYRELDYGRWNIDQVLGENSNWWWIFLGFQIAVVAFSLTLIVLCEIRLRSKIVQALFLMVFTLMFATAASLTNTVGGKWRYGEDTYLLLMPFQGGSLFTILQGIGWFFFSSSVCITLLKLFSLLTDSGAYFLAPNAMTRAGVSGLIAELALAASLLVFDAENLDHRAFQKMGENKEERKDQNMKEGKVDSLQETTDSTKEKRYLARWQETENLDHWALGKEFEQQGSSTIQSLRRKTKKAPTNVNGTGLPKGRQESHHRSEYRRSTQRRSRRSLSRTRREEREHVETKEETSVMENVSTSTVNYEVNNENAELVHEEDLFDGWEECEDEAGNIYYYNTLTGDSSQSCPTTD